MDENEVGLSSTSSERFDDPMNPLEEWIPTCAEELKHAIGIVFDSLGDGLEFNTRYAHAIGFSMRKSSQTKDKNDIIIWKHYVCSKEGFKEKKKIVLPELILDKNSLPKDRKRKKQERYAMQRLFSRGQEKVNMQLSDGMKVIYIH